MDFINPPDGTVLRKVLNVVKFNYQHPQNRGEVYAYLGSAILLILVLVFSVSLKNKSYKFQNIKKYFSEQKFEVFFLLMSLVAMFFTLRNGGYFIYYTLTKGIRVFNRMAPYVSFMWVVFISFWLERHFSKKTFLIIISVIAFISLSEVNLHSSVNKMKEHISSGAQNRQLLKLEKLESELKELCTRGHIIIEPAFTKFFTNGQWLPQYLLERSNCLADGGSSIENFPNPNHLKNSTPVAKFILDGPTWLGVDDNYRIEVLSE
ncbi:MAG: hypothetical protein OHK0038_27370 [Flammeovirgaceae bacterium]